MISKASLYDSKSNLAQSGINSRTDLKASQHIQEALKHLDYPELASTIEKISVNQAQQRGGAPDPSVHTSDHVWNNLSCPAKSQWRSMDTVVKNEFDKAFINGSKSNPTSGPSNSLGQHPSIRPGARNSDGFPRRSYAHDLLNFGDDEYYNPSSIRKHGLILCKSSH